MLPDAPWCPWMPSGCSQDDPKLTPNWPQTDPELTQTDCNDPDCVLPIRVTVQKRMFQASGPFLSDAPWKNSIISREIVENDALFGLVVKKTFKNHRLITFSQLQPWQPAESGSRSQIRILEFGNLVFVWIWAVMYQNKSKIKQKMTFSLFL